MPPLGVVAFGVGLHPVPGGADDLVDVGDLGAPADLLLDLGGPAIERRRVARCAVALGDIEPDARHALRGIDELSDDDKVIVGRARRIQRFLSQPMFVAEAYTGRAGAYVQLEDTIEGFERLAAGEFDGLPEQAFFMVGTIDEAVERAKKLSGAPA